MPRFLAIHSLPVTAKQLDKVAKTVTWPAGITWCLVTDISLQTIDLIRIHSSAQTGTL